MANPQVTIVTPCYNSMPFLEDCIESVDRQTYDEIEHIVIDGNSDDGTVTWLEEHADDYSRLSWNSEPDDSMYDAIEKGFQMAEGQVYSWLNSDDKYFPWAVELAVESLKDDARWITGHPAIANSSGTLKQVARIQPVYRQQWIRKGYYHGKGAGFIQQESTFWTADLWAEAGGFPSGVQLAGDFYLWKQFAEVEDIKTVPYILGMAREHEGQITHEMENYYGEIQDSITLFTKFLDKINAGSLYSISAHMIRELTKAQN